MFPSLLSRSTFLPTRSNYLGSLKKKRSTHEVETSHSDIAAKHVMFIGTGENRHNVRMGCKFQVERCYLEQHVSSFIRCGGKMGKKRDGTDFPKPGGGVQIFYKPMWFPDVNKFVKRLSPMERQIFTVAFVGVLAGVAWFQNLGAAGLVDDTEPLFAEAARQMLVTGDFITPQFNAQPRFDKPILIYWLMALSVKLFGSSVWASRLPSAMCGVGLLIGLLVTVKNFGLNMSANLESQTDESQSLLNVHYVPMIITSAAFALNLEVVAWGSTALSDMLLTSTLGATLLSFFWGYAGHKCCPPKHRWGYPLSAVFMGLACLAKGPVGIVFPIWVCACFLMSTGDLPRVLMEELPYLKGILALVLIDLPWYGAMASKHGLVYWRTFFGYHNMERFVQGVNHHGGRPWWYGLAVVVIMYFPWSLSLPPALLHVNPWRQPWRMAERSQMLPLFAAAWLASGFAFFALSSTQELMKSMGCWQFVTAIHDGVTSVVRGYSVSAVACLSLQLPSYYLPIAPAIAMLAAAHLSKDAKQQSDGVFTGLATALFYQLLAGLIWFCPALLRSSGDAAAAKIGQLMGEKHLHEIGFVLLGLAGTVASRTAEFATAYGSQLQPENISIGTNASSSDKTILPLWVLHATVMILFLGIFLNPVYKVVDSVRQAPLRELAHTAAKQQDTGEPLVMVGTRMPSVVYYSKLPTAFFDTAEEASAVIQEEAAPGVKSALIITDGEWDENSLSPQLLATAGDYKLLRVHRKSTASTRDETVGTL